MCYNYKCTRHILCLYNLKAKKELYQLTKLLNFTSNSNNQNGDRHWIFIGCSATPFCVTKIVTAAIILPIKIIITTKIQSWLIVTTTRVDIALVKKFPEIARWLIIFIWTYPHNFLFLICFAFYGTFKDSFDTKFLQCHHT